MVLKSFLLFLAILGVSLAIFVENGGGSSRRRFHSSSSSSSSHSHDHDDSHHHHHHGGRPRPPRPNTPPPPPPPTPPPPRDCRPGSIVFRRSSEKWCVRVYPTHSSYNEARAACRRINATLTGVQSYAELQTLAEEGRIVARANGIGESAIWLGARRRAACPRAGVCGGPYTFEWTDGVTTGSAGFVFGTNEPSGHVKNGIAQDCVNQLIYPYSDRGGLLPSIAHGLLDDQWCADSMVGNPLHRMYACGRRP